MDEQPFYLINKPGGCILYLQPAPAGLGESLTTTLWSVLLQGAFLS